MSTENATGEVVKDSQTDEVDGTTDAETTEATTTEAENTETEQEAEPTETRENARIRELVDEKKALNQAIDLLSQRQQPIVQQREEAEEEIDPAVQKKINQALAKQNQEYNPVVTAMAEKLDDLESRSTIPSYDKNKDQIEEYKNKYVRETGRWISRFQAYANLLAMGKLAQPKKTSVVVNKAKTRVVTETKSQGASKSSSQKSFRDMTLAEKEAKLDGVKF